MNLPVYLDHAATTGVAPEVLDAMLPFFTEAYGNPATLYSVGMMAREAVETAREIVADALNASPDEIIFTSGGTEADNAAIFGAARSAGLRGSHLMTTPIEHHAVLEPMKTLTKQGFELELLPIDSDGQISLAEAARRLRSETRLVSVMHANNEIGAIQPIAEIGALCRAHNVLFHTDAVQTFGRLPLDVRAMKVDMLSISAHKLYGPKGIGACYIRRGIPLARYMEGGGQEKGRRGGTLNVPGIVGLGKAAELAFAGMQRETERLTALRNNFVTQLQELIPDVRVNGGMQRRLANNVSICVAGLAGEPMLLALDAAGICASAGSACSSGSMEPSHVLTAIGIPRETARGALRFTLGRSSTAENLEYAAQTLARIVQELRSLSGVNATAKTLAEAL